MTQKIEWKDTWKTGVLATWILGMFAHAYRFFNFLPNWDSLYNFRGVGQTNSLGRIFLWYFGKFSSDYDLTWVNGALSLCYISVTVILLIELFGIESRLAAALMAGLIVTYPTVTSSFAYMYTADPYMAAFLMAVGAVYLTRRFKYGVLPGIVILGVCIGTYQAYLTVAFVVILILVILDLVIEKKTFREMFFADWKFAPLVVGGFVFYEIAQKLLFAYLEKKYGYAITLSPYQGVDKVGLMAPSNYVAAVQMTIEQLKIRWCLHNGVLNTNKYGLLHLAVVGGIALATILLVIKNKTYKNIPGLLVSILAIILLPFAAFGINFASPTVGYHTLMEMAICFIYILLLLYIERGRWEKKAERVLKGFGVFVLVAICYMHILQANYAYYQMNLSYEKSYNMCSDLLQRIQQQDAYPSLTVVYVSGSYHAMSDDLEELNPSIMGVSQDIFLNDEYHYISMWKHCFGRTFGMATSERKEIIRETEEYQNMPVYPSAGSVAVICDTIVIKLSED